MMYLKYFVILLLGLEGIGAGVHYGIRHRDCDPNTETDDVEHVPRYNKKSTDESKLAHQSGHGQNTSKRMNVREGVDRSGYAITIRKMSSVHRRAASKNFGVSLAPQAGPVGNGEPPFPLTGEDPLDAPSPTMGGNDKNPPPIPPSPSTNPTPFPTPHVYLSQFQVPGRSNDPTSSPTSKVHLAQVQVPRSGNDPTSLPTSNVHLSQLQVGGVNDPTSSPTSNVHLSQLQVRGDGDNPTSLPTSDISLSQLQVTRNGNDEDAEMTPSNDGLSINYLDDDDGYLVRTQNERTPSNDP